MTRNSSRFQLSIANLFQLTAAFALVFVIDSFFTNRQITPPWIFVSTTLLYIPKNVLSHFSRTSMLAGLLCHAVLICLGVTLYYLNFGGDLHGGYRGAAMLAAIVVLAVATVTFGIDAASDETSFRDLLIRSLVEILVIFPIGLVCLIVLAWICLAFSGIGPWL